MTRVVVVVGLICLGLGCGDDGGSSNNGSPDGGSPLVVKLTFSDQPVNGAAGSPLAPVRVAFVDELGAVLTDQNGPISIALSADAPADLLHGTTVVNATAGVATFDQLVIAAPASHLVLAASAQNAETVSSEPFDVTLGEPSSLSTLTVTPSTAVADGLAEISLIVTLRNAGGLALPGYAVQLAASGTHNTLAPAAAGVTDAQGQFQVVLRSTFAEMKTVTAIAGALVLTDSVTFTQPPCTPLLGGLQTTLVPDFIRTLRSVDVDGDSHVDLAFAQPSWLVVMRGLGNGRFRPAERYATGSDTTAVAAGDFDNDSDIDFIVARSTAGPGELIPFVNSGNGTLQQATSIMTFAYPAALEAVDLDGDGALDVVVRAQHTVSVLRGLGNGTFQLPVMYSWSSQRGSIAEGFLAIADVNNDGHPDVVTSDSNSEYVVLLGSSSGTLQVLPAVYMGQAFSLALGDLDGDGYADLAYGLSWLHGNGDGTFGTATNLSPFRHATVTKIVDLNGDGHLDILGGSSDYPPRALDILLGNGNGTFQAEELRALNFDPRTAAIADFNEDGRIDVVVGADAYPYHALSILLGSAPIPLPGVTFHGAAIGSSRAIFASKVGDFDGNGTLDFVAVNSVTHSLGIQLSDANLALTAMPTVSGVSGTDIEVADFNGDNKLDVVWANGTQLQWLRGHGDGNLDNPVGTSLPRVASALTAVDLDGNGVLDLVMVDQPNAMITVAFGNGDGTFGSIAGYAVGNSPRYVAADDVDADGDQDLLVTTPGSSSFSVLLNQGNGTFSAATSYLAGAAFWLTAADLDGDGNHDVAVADDSANLIRLYKGHGDGTFAAPVLIPTGVPTGWIAAMDIDADGILDLVASAVGLVVLRGNGNGTFQAPLFYDGGAASLRDFTGDGLPDGMTPLGAGFVLSRHRGCG